MLLIDELLLQIAILAEIKMRYFYLKIAKIAPLPPRPPCLQRLGNSWLRHWQEKMSNFCTYLAI